MFTDQTLRAGVSHTVQCVHLSRELVKTQLLTQRVWDMARDSAFPTSFPEMLMLLVQEHFEAKAF